MARDQVKREGVKKQDALRSVRRFVQNIHHFRDHYVDNRNAPFEKVVVFDEAQRAWDSSQASKFMEAKRGHEGFEQSEPEFLISVMDRHEDWCTIVCLIGGGQEINVGEEYPLDAGKTPAEMRGQAPLADWDICDACECGLPCRPIRKAGDGYRAECPLDRRHDIDLTEDDLREFRIGAAALASVIGAAAGFGAAPKLAAEKVWRLGDTPSGRAVFLVLESAALTSDGIIASLRQAAQGSDVTILAPQLPAETARRHQDAGFHLIETLEVLTPATNGLGGTIDVAALAPVPLAPVLRVRRATAEVQWDGRSVILSRQIFPVLERLLEKAQSRDQVASGSHVEGTTAREAKDLIRELRDAFKAAGFSDAESKVMIETVRNRGYRLGVPATEILVDGC